jgi:hypothetical protein
MAGESVSKSGAKSDIAAKLERLTALVNQRFDQLEGQIRAMPRDPSASGQPQKVFEDRDISEAGVPDSVWQARLTRIEQQIRQLTQQVQQLTRQGQQLERRVQQLELKESSSTGTLDTGEIDPADEIEDEPDEILVEFMEPGERA